MNSVKSIERAINYEIQRQSDILDKGGKVIQETRRYNENHDDTKALRSKEEAHDYRYFPEPDIPPVYITDAELAEIKAEIPELPNSRYKRYTKDYNLTPDEAELIISSKEFSDFYDAAIKSYNNYKQISNMMLVEVNHLLNDSGLTISDVRFTPDDIAELVKLSEESVISKKSAKDILAIMFKDGGKPEEIAKTHGFIMDNDASGLEEIIDKVLSKNADSVERYKAGNQKLFGFLMGQVLKEAGKSANPKIVKDILTKKIS